MPTIRATPDVPTKNHATRLVPTHSPAAPHHLRIVEPNQRQNQPLVPTSCGTRDPWPSAFRSSALSGNPSCCFRNTFRRSAGTVGFSRTATSPWRGCSCTDARSLCSPSRTCRCRGSERGCGRRSRTSPLPAVARNERVRAGSCGQTARLIRRALRPAPRGAEPHSSPPRSPPRSPPPGAGPSSCLARQIARTGVTWQTAL
jgi:hypothetical protein